MPQIKTRLRVLLAERDLKQYQLAEQARLSPTTVSDIARDDWDRISRDVMRRICETLECQPGDLCVME